ncbi:MAG: MATE family efflux transporter [Acidimicrobiia bacterium]|nr:MATE family efflux transporter [Acidimicrobiia bacterium]
MFRITDEDRSIARLAVPALGALAAEPLVALVDTAFVGRLGEEPLAALGVVNGVLGLAFFLFIVLTYAGTPLIARAVGLGDRDRATRLVNQSIMVAAVLMVVGLVVIEGAAHLLIDLMGAGPEVAPQAVDYLRIRGLGLPALLMITVGSSVYRGVGDTRTAMFVSVGLSLVNLILDPVFIFGLGWGLAGAGWASVIAQTLGGAAFVLLYRSEHSGLTPRWSRPRWRDLRELLGAGSALFIRTAALISTFTVATAAAARLGDAQVAAHQVVIQLWYLLALVLDAVAIAAQNLIARYLATDPPTSARLARRMLFWGWWSGTVIAISLWLLRHYLPGWFTTDRSVVDFLVVLMPFIVLSQPLNGLVFVLDGILIGATDFAYMAKAMVVVAVLTCTLIGLAGSIGMIWWALVIMNLARLGAFYVRYRRVVL